MVWRKKWRNTWDDVRYCSESCRMTGVTESDRQLETAIIDLLNARGSKKTICPSEAAVKVAGTDAPGAWRPLMQAARRAARRLFVKGAIDILQHGRPVDPSTAKGPIRLRLRKRT